MVNMVRNGTTETISVSPIRRGSRWSCLLQLTTRLKKKQLAVTKNSSTNRRV